MVFEEEAIRIYKSMKTVTLDIYWFRKQGILRIVEEKYNKKHKYLNKVQQ